MLPILQDSLTRRLYAADASMYEEMPVGVAFPQDGAELRELVLRCKAEGLPITARAAGTSLAGQATGAGIIVDVSRHLDRILSLDPEGATARVEPGVIRDSLNRSAAPHGLHFGPDTSTTNRCTIGGMIGNNSAGSFSIRYGTTRDHVTEIEAVLSDGSEVTFRSLNPEELADRLTRPTLEGAIYRGMVELLTEHREAILEAYPHPDIVRRNTGYALDRLCAMDPITPGGEPFSLVPLLCGSEGTLALTRSAVVRLVAPPKAKALVVSQFRTLNESAVATVRAVAHDPSAVELVDDPILQATKVNLEQRRNRFFLEGDPEAILITEIDGPDSEDVARRARALAQEMAEAGLGYAHPVLTAPRDMQAVWELRKAGLGLLMGLGKESRSPSFTEDTAVRVEDLPAYVEAFQEILRKHGTRCVFYGHASVGELHLRPMIDLTAPGGIDTMKTMAREIAELVRSFRGSLSGEHGDGRARAPFLEIALGSEMMPLLRWVKELWDPGNLFNPGKIVDAPPMERDLRFSPEYTPPEVDTVFHWRDTGGFAAAVEACNGAGVCRKLAASGGTMCPSYQATHEERDSTRGRANLFRQLFSGRQADAFTSDELGDALSLCLSCKACKSECPANVDMARMKAEYTHGRHQREGIPFRDRFFGEPERFYPLAALTPGLTNSLIRTRPVRALMGRITGADPRRALPSFARESFSRWYRREKPAGRALHRGRVALLVDVFTDRHEPEIARAALRLLQHLGYAVELAPVQTLGRPQLSRGLLAKARALCEANIPILHRLAVEGVPIVGLEPSELLTLRDEYLDLCRAETLPAAREVSAQAYLLEEFLLRHLREYGDTAGMHGRGREVALHGHCHTKALVGNGPLMEVLQGFGFTPRELRTGCCGMAGSFGYEKGKYETSMAVGELALFPAVRALGEGEELCAPGFSCRHQVRDGTGREGMHPAILLAGCIP